MSKITSTVFTVLNSLTPLLLEMAARKLSAMKIPRIYINVRCLGWFLWPFRRILYEKPFAFAFQTKWLANDWGGNKKCNNFCLLRQWFWQESLGGDMKSIVYLFQPFQNSTLKDKLTDCYDLRYENCLFGCAQFYEFRTTRCNFLIHFHADTFFKPNLLEKAHWLPTIN